MVVGESWVKHTVHLKGFDQFHSTEFEEGATRFLNILKETGLDVTYVRAHEVSSHFPSSIEELKKFVVEFKLCDKLIKFPAVFSILKKEQAFCSLLK